MPTADMLPQSYDLVVIGAGPAGEKGARTAAAFGKRVAVVEKGHEVGGAVANTGTLPSKTLRETALALSGIKSRKLYGVDLSLRREATIADLMWHEKRVASAERHRILANLAGGKVDLYRGQASFVDPHVIRLSAGGSTAAEARASDGLLLRADHILIATGSTPIQPPEFPFHDSRICDSDEILRLKRMPRCLAVVGAGVIGSEYACTFAALGVEVHAIDGRDALLPFLDAEVSAALLKAMEELGVKFHWKQRVAKCEAKRGMDEVMLTLDGGATLKADCVLIAAGRNSNTADLNLSVAGITPGERGVLKVDDHYATTTPHIYAAGDVIGPPGLAATSMEQARVAMCHAFDRDHLKSSVSSLLPSGIYTIPEVSVVGETEQSAQKKGIDYVVGKASYSDNARGQIIGDRSGFLKLLFRRDGMKLIGVHVIGEHATEVVHIGLMAMLADAGTEIFNRACFNYPTLGDMYKHATYDAMFKARMLK